MGWRNPVVNGTVLAQAAIQSPGYGPGTGWAINQDGTSSFTGGQFIADGTIGAILSYSGTPAAGNLIASLSAFSGSDQYGNAILPGWTIYQLNTAGGTTYAMSMTTSDSNSNPSLSFFTAPSYSGPWSLSSSVIYDTVNIPGLLTFTGNGLVFDGAGYPVLFKSGSPLVTGGLVGEDPNNPGNPETWHNATLLNGWALHSTFPCQYQKKSDNEVEIIGRVNGSAATSSTILILPPGYVPNNGFQVCEAHDFNDTANTYGIYVQDTGEVQAVGPSTTPSDLNFHGYIPLITNSS